MQGQLLGVVIDKDQLLAVLDKIMDYFRQIKQKGKSGWCTNDQRQRASIPRANVARTPSKCSVSDDEHLFTHL